MTHIVDTISQDKLTCILKDLPNNKAAGPSHITYQDIKNLSILLISWLLELFNNCITQGAIPL